MPPAPLLGAASIVIDQVTLGAGTAGRSRNDGVLAQVVTLRNADNTSALRWQWVLEVPRGSAAVLSSPSSASCQFTPDIIGTYAITLLINEGKARTQVQKRLFAVKSTLGRRYPAQGEGNEANWTSAYTGVANETGWWEDLIDILIDATAVDAGVEARLDVAGRAENLLAVRSFDPPVHDDTAWGQVNLGADGTTGDNFATVAGGHGNTATAISSSVLGGESNTALGLSSAVCGGNSNTASGAYAFIGAGSGNSAGDNCSIGGGVDNVAGSNCDTVGGGSTNNASGNYSTIGGGTLNLASGAASVIAGGGENEATGDYASVIGGNASEANGDYSIAGGRGALVSADYGIALNRGALSVHAGAVVLKDGTVATLASSAAQQLTLGFTGGIRVFVQGSNLRIYAPSDDANYRDIVSENRQTTDGTGQSLTIATIPSGQQVRIRGALQGRRVGNPDVRVHYFDGAYYEDAGVVTLLNAALEVNQVRSANLGAAWSSSLSISGFDIKLNFTGTAGQTVNWVWDFDISMGGSA